MGDAMTTHTRINRRRFCQNSLAFASAGAVGWALGGDASPAAIDAQGDPAVNEEPLPIIDPHQHLWDLSVVKLSWLAGKDVAKLNRSYVTSDYLAATKGLNVVKAVYMEVDADDEYLDKEAQYVLDLIRAGNTPTVAAVIGGRPASPEFKKYITRYADNPHVKGVRQILHVPKAPRGMCLDRQYVENVQLLGKLGLCFDLCLRPGEIGDGVKLAEKCPKTRFVVDHCGNMDVRAADQKLRATWMEGMRAMAGLENTVCKISGIIVTADKTNWKPADLEPNVNFCIDTFGEERAFFAGDWPVCTLTASYRDWVGALQSIVRDKPRAFRKKLFHDNAARFYGLT